MPPWCVPPSHVPSMRYATEEGTILLLYSLPPSPINLQGATLTPRDVAVYLERTWHLYVPGFAEDERLRPYRKVLPLWDLGLGLAVSVGGQQGQRLYRKVLLLWDLGLGFGAPADAHG